MNNSSDPVNLWAKLPNRAEQAARFAIQSLRATANICRLNNLPMSMWDKGSFHGQLLVILFDIRGLDPLREMALRNEANFLMYDYTSRAR